MLFRFYPAFTAAYVPFDVHFARNSPFGVRLETVFILFFTFFLFGPVYLFIYLFYFFGGLVLVFIFSTNKASKV